jgi:uroporphyrinogen-III synthase
MPAAEPIESERPLAGRRIALVEHRELDRLGRMLEEQGAATLRCPLVAIADAPDPAAVRAWLERAIAAPFDDLVLMTGEGLRRLCGAAARGGLDGAFRDALARMRTVTRGPKPARALREIGLSPGLRAAVPTTDGIIAALSGEDLTGRRIGLQLPPDAPSRLADFLSEAGALPDPVAPYVYVPQADPQEIAGLIDAMSRGEVDAIAFTSAPQVARLFDAAAADGIQHRLLAALRRTLIAAIGPIVAGELQRHGLGAAIMPQDSFFMKPLVGAIAAALSRRE